MNNIEDLLQSTFDDLSSYLLHSAVKNFEDLDLDASRSIIDDQLERFYEKKKLDAQKLKDALLIIKATIKNHDNYIKENPEADCEIEDLQEAEKSIKEVLKQLGEKFFSKANVIEEKVKRAVDLLNEAANLLQESGMVTMSDIILRKSAEIFNKLGIEEEKEEEVAAQLKAIGFKINKNGKINKSEVEKLFMKADASSK